MKSLHNLLNKKNSKFTSEIDLLYWKLVVLRCQNMSREKYWTSTSNLEHVKAIQKIKIGDKRLWLTDLESPQLYGTPVILPYQISLKFTDLQICFILIFPTIFRPQHVFSSFEPRLELVTKTTWIKNRNSSSLDIFEALSKKTHFHFRMLFMTELIEVSHEPKLANFAIISKNRSKHSKHDGYRLEKNWLGHEEKTIIRQEIER